MRLAQLLRLNERTLKLVAKYKLNSKDMKYINIYYDFRRMRYEENMKYDYVIAKLATDNGIGISKVKSLLKKFNINIDDDV